MTVMVASRETLPVSARHTYSPESATESCDSRRRDPDTWGHGDRGCWHQPATHSHHPPPCPCPHLPGAWLGGTHHACTR